MSETGKRFLGLSSFEMLAMFRRGMFYAYLTIYLRHYLGLSVTASTLFATLPMVVNVASQTFIWGALSDRLQLRRSLIMTGEILGAVGTLVVWYLHRLPDSLKLSGYIVIFGLTLVELFWSMSNISWSALISDLYLEHERGRIQGRLASMGGLGRIAGVWIGGLLYEGLNRHSPGWGFYHGDLFFIAASVMVISTLPLFLLPEGGFHISNPGPDAPRRIASAPPPELLRVFIIFLVGITMINFGRNAIAIVFPQYLTLSSAIAVGSRTLSYILNTQSAAIVCFGWIAGWIGRKMGPPATLLAGSASAVLALFILATCTALPLIYLGSFLRGVADATILASAYELASVLIPPHQRARRFAWFNATFFLSWGVPGTLLVGPLIDFLIARGHAEALAYRVSFGTAGILVLSGLCVLSVLFYFVRPAVRHTI